MRKAIRLIARVPVVVAAWHRIRNGHERPCRRTPTLSHAGQFPVAAPREEAGSEMAKDLDTCLILHADHTFNASTFACREVVSTQAHMYAGVAAGVGALSGSLHGGANAQVMKMLWSSEDREGRPGWVQGSSRPGEDHGHGPCGLQDHGPPGEGS